MKDSTKTAQCPLILRAHRLMDAFAKSDDERDFYLDRLEGFIIYVDLMKTEQELASLKEELIEHKQRYVLLPKLTYYETKKIMEGFVNEKVYDIDTKEKLIDIIQSKDAREHFLDFIYDHLTELEKWQQYYQERSRIRIIEWLRNNQFQFVFEEDLEIDRSLIEKTKQHLFDVKPPKDVAAARDALHSKAKTYYSTEALNPRPKRGRPPKQTVKVEVEQKMTTDLYTTVPSQVRPFLYIPDITSTTAITFSSKYDTEEEFLASRNASKQSPLEKWDSLSKKLASLKGLGNNTLPLKDTPQIDWSKDDDEGDEEPEEPSHKKPPKTTSTHRLAISQDKKSSPKESAKKTPQQVEKKRVSSKKELSVPAKTSVTKKENTLTKVTKKTPKKK